MSWFTRSIANTLQLNNDEADDVIDPKPEESSDSDTPDTPGSRGVKEDLSEITKTLTSKFWGVTSFLAPPPPSENSNELSEQSDRKLEEEEGEEGPAEALDGIRRDFAEIGGRFRSGITKLSNNIDVSEITKLASSLLKMEDDDKEVIGVTDDVVAFIRDVTMHPETWLDFPLPYDEDDVNEDFELSDAQQEHALTVESLAPRLAALRIELCPGYMSESSFWKIYFVLLHPRLKPDAAELLSTPEIVKARAALTHELKSRPNAQRKEEEGARNSFPCSENKPTSQEEQSSQAESVPLEVSATQSTTAALSADVEIEKHSISSEVQIVDKSVIQEEPRYETKPEVHNVSAKTVVEDKDDNDDADDWLKEDSTENVTVMATTTIPIENDEDVSFSDLEEDDEDAPKNGSDSSTKSRDWVQLGSGRGQASGQNSKMKESNNWLDVDDIDVA